MENKYEKQEPQELDALDNLIVHELTQQAHLREMMQKWDAHKRNVRRIRMLPILSNILSVAALMTVGFFLQALMPRMTVASNAQNADFHPAVEKVTNQPSQAQSPQCLPTDSNSYKGQKSCSGQ